MTGEEQNTVQIADGPFQPAWESLEKVPLPRWYVDGKFGIFIHWGLYCVPAFGSEWYPRHMYLKDKPEFEHHLKTYGPQSKFGYKDFMPLFKAEKFDAAAWVGLFKEAGARFVVPVAEHHDGFAMYDTKLSRWNAAAMGPKRDIIGELSRAVRQAGMVFGVSSHRIEHFWFMNGGTQFDSDVKDPAFADFYGPAKPDNTPPEPAFMEDWLARCIELVDKYQPQLFWFDWWIEQPAMKPYLRRFAAHYYNRAVEWDRGVAINYKNDAYTTRAAVLDIERGQMSDIRPFFWQNDTSVAKNSWGYIRGLEYKTAETIVGDLVDVVSKNGALLLNIGPRPDGTIPDEDQAILRGIGRWLGVNGEAIYGTRPWKVFGEGPTQVVEGGFTDTKRQEFTAEDFRFTTRGQHTLYATCLGRTGPGEQVTIVSLGTNLKLHPEQITQVSLLGCDQPLTWSRQPHGLRVHLPAALAGSEYGRTLRIERNQPI